MEITAQLLTAKSESAAEMPLSVSKVKTFDDCRAKFRYSYIEKLPKKEWDFHVFGQFLHEVLEKFHLVKIDESNKAPNHQIMTNCFKQSVQNFGSKIVKSQKDEAWEILNNYLQLISLEESKTESASIIGLEKNFYIDISLDGKPRVMLNGFIDRIQIDPDGIIHVADYKTTKNKKYLKDFFQLLTYAFVLMLEDPEIKKVRASFILLRHNFEYLTKEYHREEVMPIKQKFIEYAEQISKEKLWRPSPSFLCKFCDFLEKCDEGFSYLSKRNLIKMSDFGKTTW